MKNIVKLMLLIGGIASIECAMLRTSVVVSEADINKTSLEPPPPPPGSPSTKAPELSSTRRPTTDPRQASPNISGLTDTIDRPRSDPVELGVRDPEKHKVSDTGLSGNLGGQDRNQTTPEARLRPEQGYQGGQDGQDNQRGQGNANHPRRGPPGHSNHHRHEDHPGRGPPSHGNIKGRDDRGKHHGHPGGRGPPHRHQRGRFEQHSRQGNREPHNKEDESD